MFWLVESNTQFENLQFEIGQEVFVLPIYQHPDIHPAISDPLCLYIRDITQDKGFLINISHPEALTLDRSKVEEYLNTFQKIYTPDRKALHHFHYTANSVDLNFVEYKEVDYIPAYNFYNQKYYSVSELGSIIPIVKHYEQCEYAFGKYKPSISRHKPNPYIQDISDVFWFIERNGLKINSAFERYFELERPFLSRTQTYSFSQYNLYTTTGRPSNTFNTLNYAALNKENGCRSVFIPRNDFLLEIDLTAYHPTLISKLVGYQSPTGDIYEDFAAEFAMDRSEAKILVFRQLYGNVYDQYKDFEFFKLTKEFISKIWSEFMTNGQVTGFESGQVFFAKELDNMNPQKLFNYLIQNLETSSNVALLKDILYIINSTKTKLVLYTYDAFLFDFSKEDKQCLRAIINLFEEKELKVKTSYGTDYNSLKSL